MRRIAVVVVACALAGCVSDLPPPRDGGLVRMFHGQRVVGTYISPTAYLHYIRAQLASLDGHSLEAADELRRAIASDGASAYLRTRLAEELMALGRLDEARDELDQAMRLEPTFAEAWLDLGRIQLKLGDPAAAEVSFRHALEVDRSCEEAYLSLAALYRDRGDSARADGIYRTMADRVPDSARAHLQLAHSAEARGELGQAEAELRRALQLEDGLVEARTELADLERADGRSDAAAGDYRAVFERLGREPRAASPLILALRDAGRSDEAQAVVDGLIDTAHGAERQLQVGWLLLGLHQPERARALADQAAKTGETSAVQTLRGAALGELGRTDAAIAELAKVGASSPDTVAAVQRRARILIDAGRAEEALAAIGKVLAACERPADQDALNVLLAEAHERAGRRPQGARLLEGALAARPDSEPLALALGALLVRSGEVARAIEVGRALLKRAPASAGALAFVGATSAEGGGKLREAQRLLERAFGLKPTSGEIADRLGLVYLKAGRLDDAQRLLERAERMAPEAPEVAAHLGDLFLARGDRGHALVSYRRALGHKPEERLRHAVEEQLLLLENGRVGAR